jgi:class 3 adenylate cyclase
MALDAFVWPGRSGPLRIATPRRHPVRRTPRSGYARSGEVAIAYQVVGAGSPDVVFVRGLTGDLLSTWEQPLLVRHVDGLAACGRVLMLDKRGTGLSDRVREVQAVETTMDDVRAVMDAAGSESAVLWMGGTSTGIGVLFAATYPERCAGLVLFDPRIKGTRAPDYPWAATEEEWRDYLAGVRGGWGERDYLEDLAREWAPEVADDDGFRDWFVWHMRRSLSPGAALTSFCAAKELDVSDVLAAVRVPTLILPRPALSGPAHFTAERIRDAELVELPAFRGVYTWVDDAAHRATMEATEAFVSRLSRSGGSERVLATILFTDIVGSTELAARIGDSAWRVLLQRHHALVRSELARYHGRELDTAGDGFFAAFDGPARAVHAACAIRDALRALEIEIRAGLHTGECEVSDGKMAGIAVSIGSRISSLAAPGEVLVSSTVKDLVAGSGLKFDDRGNHQLKGISEAWHLFAVAC